MTQTKQNPNKLINQNLNTYKLAQKLKNLTFLETITIYDVESYKELNKLLTYDEEEGLREYYKSHHHHFYDYKSLYDHNHLHRSNNPNTRIRRNPDECCLVL